MNKKIVFLSLDERPCTFDFARLLAETATGYTFTEAPRSLYGQRKIAGDVDGLWEFTKRETIDADILILPVDVLIYGGLAPSRVHDLSLEKIEARMDQIPTLKKNNPNLKIYAYDIVMRCPRYDTNEEEPDYYGYCGQAISQIGIIKHKAKLGLCSKEEAASKLQELEAITKGNEKDYERRREINLKGMIHLLDIAKDNFTVFVNPQDDSSPYGYTQLDREVLLREIKKRGMDVLHYPGADETGMVLLSRAILDDRGIKPKVKVIYPKKECVNAIPLEEDRPIKDTLACQLATAGLVPVENDEDLDLFMNYPTHDVVNMATMVPGDGYPARDLPSFTDKIAAAVKSGKPVMLCDGAYCNGGDYEMVKMLSEKTPLLSLASYAGWNSSSNSLGTTLAQGIFVYLFGKSEKQNNFLAERFYEDLGWCGHSRFIIWKQVCQRYGLTFADAKQKRGIGASLAQDFIAQFMDYEFPELASLYEISDCYLPWKRFYEVGLTLKRRN